MRHQLMVDDFQQRRQFSEWFTAQFQNPWLLLNAVVGDKAGFALNYRGSNCGNNVILETFLLESIVNRLSYLEMVDMEIPPL